MGDKSDDTESIEERGFEDEMQRKNRNRERNKEHARKTRMRKKEQLDFLKSRVHELEEEGRRLKQEVEACNVASILIGLSSGDGNRAPTEDITCPSAASASLQPSPASFSETLSGGKRKRFLSLDGADPNPSPMELNIKGQVTLVGGAGNNGKTQMNWKTGVYFDENGKRQQLTSSELKALRRERNRMHAKMTRDRKKCFVASLKRVISKLEEENQSFRELLERSQEEKNNEDTHEEIDDRKPESIGKNSPVSPNLTESSTALMSISNSRIFTVG
ncbi:hypothetical protein ACHAW6_003692 [Cyclotella cf. meneghiniana]